MDKTNKKIGRKAIALLYKLEKYTIQLADVSREIIELSRKIEER